MPDGDGLLHCLLLALVPEPQVLALQSHDVHSPQLPLTKTYIYKKFNNPHKNLI